MDDNINGAPQEYNPVPVEEAPQGPPIKKIISLVVGVVVVLVLVLLFIFVILPRFQSKEPENVTLTYWGIWEDTAPFSEAAEEFTRLHPNIKVNIEKQDVKALGKYIERLKTRMDNGTGPDVFRYHNSWVTQLQSSLAPLPESVVKETELDSKFYPVVENDLKINGAYYGVPVHFDTLALFVNEEIFRNAGVSEYPSTWDDVITIARQLTVKEGDKITTSGIALGTYDNIAHASDIVSLLLIQNGADLEDLNGSSRQSSVDGLAFYTSFARGDAKVWDETLENSTLAFAQGKLAMYIGYSWDIFVIQAMNPNLQFAIVPVPHLPQRESTIASYWVEGVSAKSQHQEAAFEFLKFLASRENMERMYAQESKTRLFGELYPREDMAQLLSQNPLIYPFVSQGGNAVSTIFSSDTHDEAMVDALNSYLGNAVRSIINDGTSPESAVETLSAGVAQVLGRGDAAGN